MAMITACFPDGTLDIDMFFEYTYPDSIDFEVKTGDDGKFAV